MKITTKLSIALALAMVLSIVSLSVWAAPDRQATTPSTSKNIQISGFIPVTGGTYQVTLMDNCQATGIVTRIEDPAVEVGPAATGFTFLTNGVRVVLNTACNVQICYPYPIEYRSENGKIYKWNPVSHIWLVLESTISSGEPKQICVIDQGILDATYALIGE